MHRFSLLGAVLIAAAITLSSQTAMQIPIWNGTRYSFPRLGSTMSLANGELNAVIPSPKSRKYDQLLSHSTSIGGWQLPSGASNVTVHCNGLRYRAGVDYSISAGGLITAIATNMTASDVVTVDFDQ